MNLFETTFFGDIFNVHSLFKQPWASKLTPQKPVFAVDPFQPTFIQEEQGGGNAPPCVYLVGTAY